MVQTGFPKCPKLLREGLGKQALSKSWYGQKKGRGAFGPLPIFFGGFDIVYRGQTEVIMDPAPKRRAGGAAPATCCTRWWIFRRSWWGEGWWQGCWGKRLQDEGWLCLHPIQVQQYISPSELKLSFFRQLQNLAVEFGSGIWQLDTHECRWTSNSR